MKKYILSIDQGTTSSRAILFNKKGEIVYCAQKEVKLIYPKEGYVEANALEIWSSVVDVINNVLINSNVEWSEIDSIGFTNQRETTVVWDKKTGMPIYNAIIWQSRQSLPICEKLTKKKELIHKKTGLLINPYFSASKIRFILDNVKGAQARAEKGELLFGTIDTWLIWKLTNGKVHATDVSNASRTMLYNIFDLKWDKELLNLFNIPAKMLPKVYPCKHDFGKLEYFEKDTAKGAFKIPDSLAVAFKTKNGRTVYDKGGVEPDVLTEDTLLSEVLASLVMHNLIFDFANNYRAMHDTIVAADKFTVDDKLYEEFVAFLKDKDYSYKTETEEVLEDLKKAADEDKVFKEIESYYNQLKEKLDKEKAQDLYKFKDEISKYLASEIVVRYYYQKGRIINLLSEDKDIAVAKSILKDQARYKSILSPKK